MLSPSHPQISISFLEGHITPVTGDSCATSISMLISAWGKTMDRGTVLARISEMYLDKDQCWGGPGREYIDHSQVLNQTG